MSDLYLEGRVQGISSDVFASSVAFIFSHPGPSCYEKQDLRLYIIRQLVSCCSCMKQGQPCLFVLCRERNYLW